MESGSSPRTISALTESSLQQPEKLFYTLVATYTDLVAAEHFEWLWEWDDSGSTTSEASAGVIMGT